MNKWKVWIAENTNPNIIKGRLQDAIHKADVFIGVSVPDILSASDLQRMSADPIVFALANPEPEIAPEEAYPLVRILATGRSEYPNQINNMLCFPGLFRGLLDSRANAVTEEIKLAAAQAIASTSDQRDLSEDYVIPSIFDRKVVPAVAAAVADAAARSRQISHPRFGWRCPTDRWARTDALPASRGSWPPRWPSARAPPRWEPGRCCRSPAWRWRSSPSPSGRWLGMTATTSAS